MPGECGPRLVAAACLLIDSVLCACKVESACKILFLHTTNLCLLHCPAANRLQPGYGGEHCSICQVNATRICTVYALHFLQR